MNADQITAALARIATANGVSHDGETAPLVVGDRFTKRVDRSYRIDGQRKTHGLLLLCEVTDVDERGFQYRTVEVLEETDRPDFATDSAPTQGSCAWFGWYAGTGRGDLAKVA